MAIDESLLESCSSGRRSDLFPTLRLYRWTVPTLSIGFNQKLEESVDREFCRQHGIGIVRRQTGGKAVLHDRELTYSLTAPFSSAPFSVSVSGNYRIIAEGLARGLELIGVDASIAGDDLPVYDAFSAGHCFSRLSRFELSCRGLKIIGSAQRRRRKAFLQHGSIMIESDRKMYAEATGSRAPIAGAVPFITVKEAAGRDIGFEELAGKIISGFEERLSIRFIRSRLTDEEEKLAEGLKERKYATEAWNLVP